ncbi:hypothetical protein ABPG75_010685 [Micractinium tetrahymenae]
MGDSRQVLGLLDGVIGLMGAAPSSTSAAKQLRAATVELELCVATAGLEQVDAPGLAGKLAAAGDAMSRLAAEVAVPDSQYAASSLAIATLGPLSEAACRTLTRCCQLAFLLGPQLPRQEAFRLAAGAALVLHCGTALAQRCLQVDTAPRSAGERHNAMMVGSAAELQLAAMHAALHWLSTAVRADVAAVWSRTAGRPAAVLPWLAAVLDALFFVQGVEAGNQTVWHFASLGSVCGVLLRSDHFRAHRAALAAAPDTQAALLSLLLGQAVPCISAALEDAQHSSSGSEASGSGAGGSASSGGSGTQHRGRGAGSGSGSDQEEHLEAAFSSLINLPLAINGAAAVADASLLDRLERTLPGVHGAGGIRTVDRLIRSLPLQRPASQAPDRFVLLHMAAAQLARMLCKAATQAGEGPPAAAGGSRHGSGRGSSAGSADERQELLVAQLALVPSFTCLLLGLEAGGECGEAAVGEHADLLGTVMQALAPLTDSGGEVAAAQQAYGQQAQQAQQRHRHHQQEEQSSQRHASAAAAAAWVAALDAGLQLLPLAARHMAAWQRLGQEGAASLAQSLALFLWTRGAKALQATPSELLPASSPQLWQLHSRACRAVHWLVQPEQAPLLRALYPQGTPVGGLCLFMSGVHASFTAAMVQLESASTESQALAGALRAAHWAAVRAAQPLLDNGGTAAAGSAWLALLSCLSLAVITSGPDFPGAADEGLAQLTLETLEPCQSLAGEERQALVPYALTAYAELLRDRRMPARLVVSWLASGLLGRLLRQERAPMVASAAAAEALDLESKRLMFCWHALAVLEGAARQLPAQQQQAAAELQAAIRAVAMLPSDCERVSPAEYNAFYDGLLHLVEPAQQVAQLLLQHWAQPEQVAADRLALAQAAAAHSCANLRCANLGLEGGPAAGEGRGCKRCSACRAVYYCGTACSHADWRAGHRRVCAALGAARQAAAGDS